MFLCVRASNRHLLWLIQLKSIVADPAEVVEVKLALVDPDEEHGRRDDPVEAGEIQLILADPAEEHGGRDCPIIGGREHMRACFDDHAGKRIYETYD